MTRRDFLVSSLSAYGAWLIKPKLARQIERCAEEHGSMVPVTIEKPDHVFYFERDTEIFQLDGLDSSFKMDPLTWREMIEDCWMHEGDLEESRVELYEAELDDLVPSSMMDYYHELKGYSDFPGVRAFALLSELPLADRDGSGDPLAEIKFFDGVCPGNDSRLVTGDSIMAASALQLRLLELNLNWKVVLA